MHRLAKLSSTSPQQIMRLENGDRIFTKDMAKNISEALEIEPHDLQPKYIYTIEEEAILESYRSLDPTARILALAALKGMANASIKKN